MSLLWLIMAGLIAWWLWRSPRDDTESPPKSVPFANCEICGDIFATTDLKTAPGAPEKRRPGCYAEWQSIIRDIKGSDQSDAG